ncbi:DUF1684 domain-containing protein [Rhodanobacter denitrificans]|uniref:DUF1684 domain-containing protein n=1 Tax=Rhodanobacter denitrificans TaxID=666685 RepID=UPI00269BE3C1
MVRIVEWCALAALGLLAAFPAAAAAPEDYATAVAQARIERIEQLKQADGYLAWAAPPKGGKVLLDFNLAQNLPCAITSHVVCRLAPPENRLNLAVTAGAKIRRNHEVGRAPAAALLGNRKAGGQCPPYVALPFNAP